MLKTIDETTEDVLHQARWSARVADAQAELAHEELRAAVREAHNRGVTLGAVGDVLGVSRQRVHQLTRENS